MLRDPDTVLASAEGEPDETKKRIRPRSVPFGGSIWKASARDHFAKASPSSLRRAGLPQIERTLRSGGPMGAWR